MHLDSTCTENMKHEKAGENFFPLAVLRHACFRALTIMVDGTPASRPKLKCMNIYVKCASSCIRFTTTKCGHEI